MNALQCPDTGGLIVVVRDDMCSFRGVTKLTGETVATFGAGCTVRWAQTQLIAAGLQLKGFGAIAEQRLGGSLSTNLHGCHQEEFSTHLRGLQAVLANGTLLDIDSADPHLAAWPGSIGTQASL